MESTRYIDRAVFSHVHSHQCNIRTVRSQGYATQNDIVAQFASDQGVGKPTEQVEASKSLPHSLSDISKPVLFNTHQLVCRLRYKGIVLT